MNLDDRLAKFKKFTPNKHITRIPFVCFSCEERCVSFDEGGCYNCTQSFEAFDPSHNPQLIVPFCSHLHNTQPLIVPHIVKLHNTQLKKLHDGFIDNNFLWSSVGCV